MIRRAPSSTPFPYTTLFRSNQGLWNEPSRTKWQPGAGGMCVNSICPWPGDPSKMLVGISAAGCWVTERSEEHTSELQSHSELVCRLLLEKTTQNLRFAIWCR